MSTSQPGRDGVLLISGVLGVLGNVVAVALLADQPHAYRLAGLDVWAAEIALHRTRTVASAVAFTVGLLALAIWALSLRRHLSGETAQAGGLLVAIGAMGNAFGTLTPLVLAQQVADFSVAARPVQRALLGLTLSLDALFNLTLGVGLIAIATGLPSQEKPWLRALAFTAGAASVPVCAQAVSDGAANLLVLSGPLWLAFITLTSFGSWRRDARHVA